MEHQNDGRIPGGPTTQREIEERKSHVSELVFTGKLYDYPLEARLRKHGQWRHVKNDVEGRKWELISEQKDLVESFGFNYIDQIEFMQHDRDLLFSLAERWWPQRNTFQLPVGEMTVTLWDVAKILGLPITGHPIYFTDRSDPNVLIRRYLGLSGPTGPGQKGRSDVSVSWLRSNFMFLDRTSDAPVVVDENRIVCCTRAYLLAMCGSVLFPNGTGCKVSVRLLPFFENLKQKTPHAWGAAVLSFLYTCLTEFVKTTSNTCNTNLTGCMLLLQVWSYEHFAIGRPVTYISRETGIFPVAKRWTVDEVDQAHCRTQVAPIYRSQFDSVEHMEVTWMPYIIRLDAPNMQRTSYSYSMHGYYIIYDYRTMYHPADRVLRQFGMVQIIPNDPLPSSYAVAQAQARVNSLLPSWESRLEYYSVGNLSRQVQTPNDCKFFIISCFIK
ncbi:serine/threonine-protein phosphatase 7 long form-like protein [Iris pallida]|uniref:Serine/threonine-protein phosphatase 7 long form-like protein n=1 Tax=Iris pallida TaxID=29817 RepID=A0AAX6ENL8_IRIPA|nr:serine/threonine-protein phosphatase 7 long form-like protein [Iris pallida]